jgi:hypothetical protein
MIALKIAQKYANDKRNNAVHNCRQLNIEIWQRKKRKKRMKRREEKRKEDLKNNV